VAVNALDGEIRDGKHYQAVRVYYEDTDFEGPPPSLQGGDCA
jgi:acyl-CoA thioester hydrolase